MMKQALKRRVKLTIRIKQFGMFSLLLNKLTLAHNPTLIDQRNYTKNLLLKLTT